MNIQRKLSNGNFIDAERTEYFLDLAVQLDQRYPDTYHGKLGFTNREDAINFLESGKPLRYGTDWYEQIRIKPSGGARVSSISTDCKWGGTRYVESCTTCGNVTHVCNDCEKCENCHD